MHITNRERKKPQTTSTLNLFIRCCVGLCAASQLMFAASADAQKITEHQLRTSVETLTSPFLEGREPGTRGEDRTLGYLIGRLQGLGLEPAGPDGQWTQKVPLLRTKLVNPERAELSVGRKRSPWLIGRDAYLVTSRPTDNIRIESAPLLFVGYGVSAPERGWDDYKGVDVRGKILVFLVNDPDFEAAANAPSYGMFGGKVMTYYGRWPYKFEEATRKGALGALIIHEKGPAGYDWSVVTSGRGENFALADTSTANAATSLSIQGWISRDAATDLFDAAGIDFDVAKIDAQSDSFRPFILPGANLSLNVAVEHEIIVSHNILAKISGKSRPSETVIYGAHWDAYGIDRTGPVDILRPGANDDGLGVAGLIEIARWMSVAPRPDRTIIFGFWTAEERLLLGSEFYARHPVYSLGKTVANLTVDVLQTAGAARDVILVGKGQSALEEMLAYYATRQKRTVTPETHADRGLFYRADHFSFAKRGVPVLLMMGIAGASDLVEGGRLAGEDWIRHYTDNCYHKSCDVWDGSWNVTGAIQDLELVRMIGWDLANSTAWPSLKPTSEFQAERDRSAPKRR